MKHKIYSIYDSKIELFAKPFYMHSRGEALRAWGEVVNDPETTICKHPADFTLFELGEFDEETGKFANLQTPVSLGLAIEYKKKPQEQVPMFENTNGKEA